MSLQIALHPAELLSQPELHCLREQGHATVDEVAAPSSDVVLTAPGAVASLVASLANAPAPRPAVVAVLSAARAEQVAEALAAGADDCVLRGSDPTLFERCFERLARHIDRRRQLARLQAQQEELQTVQRLDALGRLAAGVAHDFNNLLTIIGGSAELALRSGKQDVTRELQAIQSAAESGSELVRGLTTFSRGDATAPTGKLALNDAITNAAPLLNRLAGTRVNLRCDLTDRIGTVGLEQVQLERVLLNLVVNARDAIVGSGTIVISTDRVTVGTDRSTFPACLAAGEYVLLTVTDDGGGMDADTARRVFEPFFTTKGSAGTGLGLSSVYGIVSRASGHVDVISNVGDNTTFRLWFPFAPTRSSAQPRPADSQWPTAEVPGVSQSLTAAQFRALTNRMSDAVFIADVDDGRFIDVNDTACTLLGYSRDELLGLRPRDLKPPHLRGSERQWAEQVRVLEANGTLGITTVHRRSDGSNVPVDIRIALAEADGRRFVVGVSRDITGRGTAVGLLDDNRASIDVVAGWVAHQLNNPLATALTNIDWVLGSHQCSEREVGVALREARTGLLQLRGALDHLTPGLGDRRTDIPSGVLPREPGSHHEPARILVIDDDVLVATALARSLRPHRATVVENAQQGIELLEREHFDVVFCDLMMPDMTGIELFHWLEENKPDVARRVIFVTGGGFTKESIAFIEAQRERCLRKPLRKKPVHAAVRAVLSQQAEVMAG